MLSLDLINIPDELYLHIQFRAQEHNRSINEEVIALLQMTLDQQRIYPNRAKLLADIRYRRAQHAKSGSVFNSVEMLREDRGL